MTNPNFGFPQMPAANVPTNQRPWQQLPGGYDAAVQQAQQQGAQVPAPVPPFMQQTQLGQPTPQNFQQPQLQESVSPLQSLPPHLPPQMQPRQQPGAQPQQQIPGLQQVQQYTQQQVQQQPQQQAVDLNARIPASPNIPAQLHGRTVGELIGMNNGLREIALQSQMQPQFQQPQRQQAPQPQVQPQQQPQAQPFNWTKPEESIGRVVADQVSQQLNQFKQEIAPVLAPVTQQAMISQAQSARNTVASEIPHFAQIEPMIHARLRGMPPQALTDPETWRIAARVAIGDAMLNPQLQQMALAPVQQQQFQQQQPGMYPAPNTLPPNPVPNLNTIPAWFAEAPNQGGPGPQAVAQLTPFQQQMAQNMGMSAAEYVQWGGARR